jgi:hypothetical protein
LSSLPIQLAIIALPFRFIGTCISRYTKLNIQLRQQLTDNHICLFQIRWNRSKIEFSASLSAWAQKRCRDSFSQCPRQCFGLAMEPWIDIAFAWSSWLSFVNLIFDGFLMKFTQL